MDVKQETKKVADCLTPGEFAWSRLALLGVALFSVTKDTSGATRGAGPLARSYARLVGLVVKASASRAEGPGFESRLRRDFFGVVSYQ